MLSELGSSTMVNVLSRNAEVGPATLLLLLLLLLLPLLPWNDDDDVVVVLDVAVDHEVTDISRGWAGLKLPVLPCRSCTACYVEVTFLRDVLPPPPPPPPHFIISLSLAALSVCGHRESGEREESVTSCCLCCAVVQAFVCGSFSLVSFWLT